MNVGYLIEFLEGLDPDMPVRVAHNRSWPLASDLNNIVVLLEEGGEEMLWLAADPTTSENPYAPAEAWD